MTSSSISPPRRAADEKAGSFGSGTLRYDAGVKTLRVTVCELHDDRDRFLDDWRLLVAHVRDEGSELVVLPEMPFASWLAVSSVFVQADWDRAERAHADWLGKLNQLAPAAVLSSRPSTRTGTRVNEGFAWSPGSGYRAIHDKHFLPNEAGYWEANWYGRGSGEFHVSTVMGARVGMLICTEMWSLGHAEAYGRAGAQILATPRATGRPTVDKWLTGGRAAAIVAGAFSLSSNWTAGASGGDFGGQGWIIGPDGDVIGTTNHRELFLTRSIDLAEADAARRTYPRYALD